MKKVFYKNPKIIFLALVLIVIIITFAVISFWPREDNPEPRQIMVNAYQIAFSPDGKYLAGSTSNGIYIWDVQSLQLVQLLGAARKQAIPRPLLAYSPDGLKLAVSGSGGTIELWQVKNGVLDTTISFGLSNLKDIAFSSDGKYIAASNEEGGGKLWEAKTGKLVQSFGLPEFLTPVTSVGFSRDSRLFATGGKDGLVNLWSLKDLSLLTTFYDQKDSESSLRLTAPDNPVNSINFSSDTKMIVTATQDRVIKIWSLDSGTVIRTIEAPFYPPQFVTLSPDMRFLAYGIVRSKDQPDEENVLRLWQIPAGSVEKVFFGHTSSIICTTFSPTKKLLASSSLDGTIRLWDYE